MEQFFEEYYDPALYDKENQGMSEHKFLAEIASNCEGPIIDIACGTGRITIPLGLAGHEMIGVDAHQGMLQAASGKSKKENLSIKWIHEDCTNMNLNLESNFLYSVGNSFQHFLTNEAQDGLLNSVSRHLKAGGLFVFDTRFPSLEELLQPPTEEFWTSYIDADTGYEVELSTISHYDSLKQIQHYTTIRKYINQNKLVKELKTRIKLRYVFPKEMERLLEKHQLKALHIYSDWNKNPINKDSHSMIYVCQKV